MTSNPITEFPQLVEGMSERVYHSDPCAEPSLSSTTAGHLVNECEAVARELHPRLGGGRRPPTKDTEKGSTVHAMMLGVGELAVITAEHPKSGEVVRDYKTKAAQHQRDEARAAGRTPVLPHKLEEYRKAVDAIRGRLGALGIVLSGISEASLFWRSPEGIVCRGRMDHVLLDAGRIWDLKIVASAHPRACQRHIDTYGCDIQSAAYTEGLEQFAPDMVGRVKFGWLFCEVEPPYLVTPAEPDGQLQALGQAKWAQAKALWRDCLERDEWPGYAANGIVRLSPAPWAMRDFEEATEGDEAA